MRSFLTLATLTACSTTALAAVETFDVSPTLSPTQAPGTWYTDRYAPAGFQSSFFDGDNRLQHSISSADGANLRPGAFTSAFYNTQGRKYDVDTTTNALSIDLYIDSAWASSGSRMAGLWGTTFDAGNAVAGYPIIEFTSDLATPRFRAWDNGVWVDMGLPSGFAYDEWYTLNIDLSGGNFNYSVGDLAASVSAGTSAYIGNVILQGHNTTDGVSYDIYWDNFNAVPTPGAIVIASIGGLWATRRRRA